MLPPGCHFNLDRRSSVLIWIRQIPQILFLELVPDNKASCGSEDMVLTVLGLHLEMSLVSPWDILEGQGSE